MCALNSNLVRSAGFKRDLYQSDGVRSPESRPDRLKRKSGSLAARFLTGWNHPYCVGPFVLFKDVLPSHGTGYRTQNPCKISAADFALLQRVSKSVGCLAAFGDNHDAACIAIEPVDEAHIGVSQMES